MILRDLDLHAVMIANLRRERAWQHSEDVIKLHYVHIYVNSTEQF